MLNPHRHSRECRLGACLGLSWFWPICPGHGDRDYDQGIILELDVSKGGPEETSQGRFSGQNL